jgi:hypothetical protein
MVLTGERVGDEPLGADLNLANLLENFACLIGVHGQDELT